ncbi:MAG: DNA/RNA nuclease SfsA [Acetatifactor sp.]|nr:DNA/RNA nuclease SfsA [Acetatifactor sp.]
MQYINCYKGRFLERPNRFIAYVDIDGQREKVHVKNTGRCKEILLPDVDVYLEKSDNPARSTAYDLVAARKGDRIINIDSQAPNKAVLEWLKAGRLFPDLTLVRPETTFGNSRFDFYAEREGEKIFIEVKGVTQEAEDIVMFPDAPSDRAVKHVEELIQAKHAGYRVFVLFVIQMENVRFFTPNRQIHKEFADSLKKASEEGVEVIAYDCTVTEDSMVLHEPVEVRL